MTASTDTFVVGFVENAQRPRGRAGALTAVAGAVGDAVRAWLTPWRA